MSLTIVTLIPTALSLVACLYFVFMSELSLPLKALAVALTGGGLAAQLVPALSLRIPMIVPLAAHIVMTFAGMIAFGNYQGGYDPPAQGIDAFSAPRLDDEQS